MSVREHIAAVCAAALGIFGPLFIAEAVSRWRAVSRLTAERDAAVADLSSERSQRVGYAARVRELEAEVASGEVRRQNQSAMVRQLDTQMMRLDAQLQSVRDAKATLRRRLRAVIGQAKAWKAEAVARGWSRDVDSLARGISKEHGARRWARTGKVKR